MTLPCTQAWRQECKRELSCHEHPAVPRKAYLINMPAEEDKAKREYSLKQLATLGFDVEVVDGINTTHYVRPFLWLPCTGTEFHGI
jgi:hypothetical protein